MPHRPPKSDHRQLPLNLRAPPPPLPPASHRVSSPPHPSTARPMQLVIIRHAIAEDPREFASTGRPDSQRPLTEEGVTKMKRGVKGLRELIPEINLIATSPYVRA